MREPLSTYNPELGSFTDGFNASRPNFSDLVVMLYVYNIALHAIKYISIVILTG